MGQSFLSSHHQAVCVPVLLTPAPGAGAPSWLMVRDRGFSWDHMLASLRKATFPLVDSLFLSSPLLSSRRLEALCSLLPAFLESISSWMETGMGCSGGRATWEHDFLLARFLPGLSSWAQSAYPLLGTSPWPWCVHPGRGVGPACLSMGNRVHSRRIILWKGSAW